MTDNTSNNLPPAGWFPDGGGRIRWWDGSQWTEQLQTTSDKAVGPTVPEPEPEPEPKSVTEPTLASAQSALFTTATRLTNEKEMNPFYRKKWFVAVAAGVVGLVLGSAMSSAGSVEDNPKYKDMSGQLAETKSKLATSESQVAGVKAREAKAQEREDVVAKSEKAVRQDAAEVKKREKAVGLVEDDVKRNTIPGDGVYIVGDDVKPGTYRSTNNSGCYWQRSNSLKGDFESIIANGNVDGTAVITISPSDKGFTSSGCGNWKKVR